METMTPGMKKVLAEIDQETDVIDDPWRHAHGEVMKEHTNPWRLLRRIIEGESKKVVMSIKDDDGFRAWQIETTIRTWTASSTGFVVAEFSSMVARPAKSPGDPLQCEQRWTAR